MNPMLREIHNITVKTAMSAPSAKQHVGLARAEAYMLSRPQDLLVTRHVLHGGMYARSMTLKTGQALVGVTFKIATMLIVNGHLMLFDGEQAIPLIGYHVLTGSAGRKSCMAAVHDTEMTMLFPTRARTIADAEAEFTDEPERLMSRWASSVNYIEITGE